MKGDAVKKLFKLKEWLTLNEAAKRLTVSFGEEISEVDCLQLALDGHITISILLSDSRYAVKAKIVTTSKRELFSRTITETTSEGAFSSLLNDVRFFTNAELDFEYETIKREGAVVRLRHDIYDLPCPLLGSEELDVMHLFDIKQGRNPREFVNTEGAFVLSGGELYNIMESFNPLEFKRMNDDVLAYCDSVTGEKVDFDNHHRFFYPADGLGDVEFIFRRENIEKSEQQSLGRDDGDLTLNESLLVIGSMLKALKKAEPTSKRWTQDTLKAEMLDVGLKLSPRLLDEYFSSANKSFKS